MKKLIENFEAARKNQNDILHATPFDQDAYIAARNILWAAEQALWIEVRKTLDEAVIYKGTVYEAALINGCSTPHISTLEPKHIPEEE